MPYYHYKAKDIDGQNAKGTAEAEDEDDLYLKLRTEGLFLISARAEKRRVRKSPLSYGQLADFSRQLSVMLKSGIRILQAVNILKQREHNAGIAAVYENLYGLLSRGLPLSDALEKQEGVFPPLVVSMMRAGEESGHLGESAARMADYYEREERLRKAVKGAMIYPVFLLIMLNISIIMIFTLILPRFFVLFDAMEDLPLSTRFLMWFSKSLLEYGNICMLILLAVSSVVIYLWHNEKVHLWRDKAALSVPIMGKLLKVIYTARFARTLNSLYGSGVPLISAVNSAFHVLNNRYLEKQFKPVLDDLCNGVSLASALSGIDGLDEKLITGIFIGEESGELEDMLVHVADSFDYEAEAASKNMTVLIEPVMIILIAVLTGYVMLSVMLPIYQYYEMMG
ncbi:type II secretion system F family protein [Clostridium sp. MCC353]|uniref:type II secretion system F family protein n=1 Tax=Clostridium sp. MCC353 TaxID=2592646 RepID=UPI001C012B20|nr:type II secretion system F family protein [Clostridium sp. MCC353]MBT9777735.1 type II secretion system F family protein [Clostridium sp. MCC353]